MKEKAMELIYPYFKYKEEVPHLPGVLESILKLINSGEFCVSGNSINGKYYTKNNNLVSLYAEFNENTIIFKIEGTIKKLEKKFVRLSEGIWKIGEIEIKGSNSISNIYVSARMFKENLEIARIIKHRKIKKTDVIKIYDEKSSYFIIGNDLYKVLEKDGEVTTYKYTGYLRELIFDNIEINKKSDVNIEEYYMKRT